MQLIKTENLDPVPMGEAIVYKKTVRTPVGLAEVIFFERESKYVVCIPTQIGCVVGCKFCNETINKSNKRSYNLSTNDLVKLTEQVTPILSNKDKPLLISIMGHGEPSLNFGNVKNFILNHAKTFHNGNVRVSVATSGVSDNLLSQWEDLLYGEVQFKLHYSLHSTFNSIRKSLMPKAGNASSQLKVLNKLKALGMEIEINYTLIKDMNDSIKDATNLIDSYSNFHLKISTLNQLDSNFIYPDKYMVDSFIDRLSDVGHLSFELHQTDGVKNKAACGMTSSTIR